MKDVFEQLIGSAMWAGDGTVCGRGSTEQATRGLRNNLPNFLKKYNIQSMFDAPCGDYVWMNKIEFPKNFKYVGGEIVDSLVRENQAKYPGIDFRNFDLTTDSIPDVDLLFCRLCLIHFSNDDIKKTIDNIIRSNVKYILTTNYYAGATNLEIQTGGYRPVDLTKAPFYLPNPIDSIDDSSPHDAMNMSLWAVDQFHYRK